MHVLPLDRIRTSFGQPGRRCSVRLAAVLLVSILPFVALPAASTLAAPPPLATTRTETDLRAGPATTEASLAVIPAGTEVELTGEAGDGFVGVTYEGQRGWVAAADLRIGANRPVLLATATRNLPIRAAPCPDAKPLGTVPTGGVVILSGAAVGDFVAGSYRGVGGWIDAAGLSDSAGRATAPASPSPRASSATPPAANCGDDTPTRLGD